LLNAAIGHVNWEEWPVGMGISYIWSLQFHKRVCCFEKNDVRELSEMFEILGTSDSLLCRHAKPTAMLGVWLVLPTLWLAQTARHSRVEYRDFTPT